MPVLVYLYLTAAAVSTPRDDTAPVSALLDRMLDGLSSHFSLHLDPHVGNCFSLDDVSDLPGHQISVVAGDTSTLASAVGYYLRERANLTIGWPRGGGSRVAVPSGGWPTMAPVVDGPGSIDVYFECLDSCQAAAAPLLTAVAPLPAAVAGRLAGL